MARKRMIDPTIWEDENFGKLSPRAQLLFIGLFSNADDEGRIRANALFLRSTVFIYADLSLSEVTKLRDEVLNTMKHVKLYTVDGNEYIYFDNWSTFQKQRDDRKQPSNLPNPNDGEMSTKCQADDGQNAAQVKLSKVKLSKDKAADETSAAAILYLDKFNQVFGTSYKAVDPLTNNLSYWLKTYNIEYILSAVEKAKAHPYWSDKMTPARLLRRKNTKGEEVDYVGDLLNFKAVGSKPIIRSTIIDQL